jgi:hypothetical protein
VENTFPREFAANPIGAELSMRAVLGLTPRRPSMRPGLHCPAGASNLAMGAISGTCDAAI